MVYNQFLFDLTVACVRVVFIEKYVSNSRMGFSFSTVSTRDSNLVTGSRISRDWANPESRGIMRTRFSGFSGLIFQFWYSYFKDFMTVLGHTDPLRRTSSYFKSAPIVLKLQYPLKK